MTYSNLANEIVLQVISYISLAHIENFALIDRRTFDLSLPKLEQRRAVKRNAKIMTTRFGSASKFNKWASILRRVPELAKSYDIPPVTDEVAKLDYLELNGDLHWLQPMDEVSMKDSATWWQGKGTSEDQLAKLVEDTKRVGLELPPGFLKMMASTELMQRFYLGGNYFALGPSLIKCNAEDDEGGGGYVVRSFCDQQSCAFWALYLDPAGHHCVLHIPCEQDVSCWKCADEGPYGGSPIVIDDHPKYETYKGIPIACESLVLEQDHPNFEEWLVMLYFDGWCSSTVYGGRQLSSTQRQYLHHNLIKKP